MFEYKKQLKSFQVGYVIEDQYPGLIDKVLGPVNNLSPFLSSLILGAEQKSKDVLYDRMKEFERLRGRDSDFDLER